MIDGNVQYYLQAAEKNNGDRFPIEEIKDFRTTGGDLIERKDKGRGFSTVKSGKTTLHGKGYQFVLELYARYGIRPEVRLIKTEKSNNRIDERVKETSNVNLDLKTAVFDNTNRTVELESSESGFISEIEARWNDDYDIFLEQSIKGTSLDPLPYQNLRLNSRKIFRRSKLTVDDDAIVEAIDDQGATGRAIPFTPVFSSDSKINPLGYGSLSSANDTYASLRDISGAIYLNADLDTDLILNGIVKTSIVFASLGSFSLDLIIYENGEDFNVKEIRNLDTCNPNTIGNTCEYTFENETISLLKGETLAIGTLSNASIRNRIYYSPKGSELLISIENTYPPTTAIAVRAEDLFNRLIEISTGRKKAFVSSIFSEGGVYQDMLITWGSFIRNIPRIINEGEEDEIKTQNTISVKNLFEGLELLEPLMYQPETEGINDFLRIEPELYTQQNFEAIRLGETINGKFQYIKAQKVVRKPIAGNYWSKLNVGSTKTGNDYGEVNNLYSTSGNANWNTGNKTNSTYKVVSEIRTGAEDVELARVLQWSDNPEIDSEYDNEPYLIDAKKSGTDYVPKSWEDYYETIPLNVYDADSNYNWFFSPARILLRHSWKINSGLQKYPIETIYFTGKSNCNSNLITKVSGEEALSEDENISHTRFKKATVFPSEVTFELPVNQEISQMLRGKTNGIDNKLGLVKVMNEDGLIENMRLIKVDENNGQWTLIEAR